MLELVEHIAAPLQFPLCLCLDLVCYFYSNNFKQKIFVTNFSINFVENGGLYMWRINEEYKPQKKHREELPAHLQVDYTHDPCPSVVPTRIHGNLFLLFSLSFFLSFLFLGQNKHHEELPIHCKCNTLCSPVPTHFLVRLFFSFPFVFFLFAKRNYAHSG